jgi:Tol biopolymer transport system component/tRNA A-37 threonylcarbamoyl transferase component Bud32
MGEVYKAMDTRLDRTVALKFLPEALYADAELRRRFEREARAISALSHPNICTLFDVGQQDGREFLVMEYLDGETLAERLVHGAMPLDEVVRYATEIADALDKAHRLGIIHRDLKPGNIVLTRSGAKLLDFGLAKWTKQPDPLLAAADQTTQRHALTTAGMLLGTIPYMSPEQLETKEVDARTDIFSFGAILYEMATGVRAFNASSNASLIAAIMRETPTAPSRLRPITPRGLEQVIQTCLAKDPNDRFQSAHDIALALTMLGSATAPEPHVPPPSRIGGRARPWMAIAILAALIGVGSAAWLWRPRAETRAYRFSVTPPAGAAFVSLGEGGGFALSPDGHQLVFAATTPDGRSFLWLRALDDEQAHKLDASEGAEYPFWSPDSRSIAFFAAGKLKRMALPGGPAETICDAPTARGGSWSNNAIVFAPSPTGALMKVSPAGGVVSPVTHFTQRSRSHRWPLFLPDGDHFLFVAQSTEPAESGVWVASLSSDATKRILPTMTSVAFAAPDRLFHVRDHVLVRQTLDPSKLEVSGEPTVLGDRMISFNDRGWVPLSAANDGTLAFRRDATLRMRLAWYDRSGRRLSTIGEPGEYEGVSLSPDNTRVAFGAFYPDEGLNHISICGTGEQVPRRFSFNRTNQYSPIWSSDSQHIVFSDDDVGVDTLKEKPASGAGDERAISERPQFSQYAQSWSPDGRYILFRRDDETHGADIAALPLAPGAKPFVYISGSTDQTQSQFSPDGTWVAYASNESGRPEVYVQRFPASGAKWQVSSSGGEQPRWRRDGRELFFIGADRRLMAVAVRSAGVFDAAPPLPLFETTAGVGYLAVSQSYDVTNDGQRFVIAAIDPLLPAAPISVVTP